MNISNYVIKQYTTILDAMRKIDTNKKGFLVVIDDDNNAVGTLTDGDIRRAIICGKDTTDIVNDIFTTKFKRLNLNDDINKAIDLFKNEAIKFLPIVNNENKLANIITKNQLQALLLQDIHADFMYDFQNLDENIIDHEIFQRPWGFYKTTVMNKYFQSKVICVNPNSQLSLQSHDHREEYWIVAHGKGLVQLDQTKMDVHCGSSVFVPKGCKHRLVNTDEKESLIITEVQIGDYFGEDDIHRYEDIYGRI